MGVLSLMLLRLYLLGRAKYSLLGTAAFLRYREKCLGFPMLHVEFGIKRIQCGIFLLYIVSNKSRACDLGRDSDDVDTEYRYSDDHTSQDHGDTLTTVTTPLLTITTTTR
ncbi:hypothetical protein RRG08_040314 [Elysia crispata]|uniref:Secreted protein n=1 Tax=Elysia crispata TaxID=231223 RepID=A0AAE0ZWS1_9GAST|nr:hypothetical protein RRG08_040314 [Elysia crispata]